HFAGQTVDICQGKVDFAFLGGCQQVKNGVGGAAHGDVQGHGILERLKAGNVAGQHGLVVLLVVAARDVDDPACGFQKQFLAIGMRGQHGAVAGQGGTDGFGQTVHGVSREHAGAGAAGGAGGALVSGGAFIADIGVGSHNPGVAQIQLVLGQLGLAGFHGTAGYEDGRDVQAQCGNQHAGCNL